MAIGGSIVKRAGEGLLRHPKSVMVGAGIAGALAAHPFQAPIEAFQEEMLGDPQAIQKSAKAAFVTNLQDAFRGPKAQDQIDSVNQYKQYQYEGYDVNPRVNGALIFGLYNNRLGG